MKITFTLSIACILISGNLHSQGCLMVRNLSGFGQYNFKDNSFSTSEWQLSINTRYFKAFRDFKQKVDQNTPEADQNIIKSFTTDFSLTRLIENGWAVTVNLPFSANSRTADKEHGGIGTTRHTTHSFGVGDIRFTVYKWLFKPSPNQKGNVQLGLGIKLPTGDYEYKDYFYKDDTTKILAPVNASIALGDGGTGIMTELNAYYFFGKTVNIYANFYYLINPRDQNGVSTTTWRTPTPLQVKTGGDIYSVPDVYSIRVGAELNFKKTVFSLGLRNEGVPYSDLIGGNNGLRRPGHNLSVEPGITYRLKGVSLYAYVPVIISREIKQDPSDAKATEITGVYRMGTGGSGIYSLFIGALLRL